MTCYAMVRGSVLRVTALTPTGRPSFPARAAVSRSALRVVINEVTDTDQGETMRDERGVTRIRLGDIEDSIGFDISADFLRVDPGLLSLMTNVPLAYDANGDVTGFDSDTRLPAAAFALELWSRLGNCSDGTPQYGYTLFPFLKGGILTGFKVGAGRISFGVQKAQTRRYPGWGLGPYELNEDGSRLASPVSGNDMWRQTIVTGAPPEQTDGIEEFADVLDNGTAADPHPLDSGSVDSGWAATASASVIDGGAA